MSTSYFMIFLKAFLTKTHFVVKRLLLQNDFQENTCHGNIVELTEQLKTFM